MKEYMKPDIELVQFNMEAVTDLGDGTDTELSNNLNVGEGGSGFQP